MSRILLSLSGVVGILLALTFLVGLGVANDNSELALRTGSWMRYHFLLGTVTALAVVFLHSLAVTYFIGTTRWCKEVSETYALSPELVREGNRLKRRSFPWSLVGMTTVLAVITLGAAADPATGRQNLEGWAQIHFIAACLGLALIGYSVFRVWNLVTENQRLIARIVAEVRKIRIAKGLDVEDLAREEAPSATS